MKGKEMVQCKAKSKRSKLQCRNNAVCGKAVCRFHGAFAGPKTAQGIARIKEANTKHGNYTKEAFQERRAFRKMLKEFNVCLNDLKE